MQGNNLGQLQIGMGLGQGSSSAVGIGGGVAKQGFHIGGIGVAGSGVGLVGRVGAGSPTRSSDEVSGGTIMASGSSGQMSPTGAETNEPGETPTA